MPQLHNRSRKLQHLFLLTADDLFTRLLVCHHRKHAKPIDQFRGRPGFVRETLRIRSKVRSQLFEYGFLQEKMKVAVSSAVNPWAARVREIDSRKLRSGPELVASRSSALP